MTRNETTFNFFTVGIPSERAGAELRRTSLEDHIKYSLRASILTQKGERPLSPNLGSGIRDLLFKPLTPSLRMELQAQIARVLADNEPRIEVETVDVNRDPNDASRALVSVAYNIRKTKKRDQVRFKL